MYSVHQINMYSVIVDFQGFFVHENNNNKFICKEFAVYDIKKEKTVFLSFKPPFPWNNLLEIDKITARWLTNNHHYIDWNSGTIPYQNIEKEIKDILELK